MVAPPYGPEHPGPQCRLLKVATIEKKVVVDSFLMSRMRRSPMKAVVMMAIHFKLIVAAKATYDQGWAIVVNTDFVIYVTIAMNTE